MDSHLTAAEELALSQSGLHQRTPYVIRGVRQSQLSIARHSGGCGVNGAYYTYVPPTDELIRDDVVRWLKRWRKAGVKG